MGKTAFITGITGQDGYYLAKRLLAADYEVHGLVRRASAPNTHRISGLLSQELGGRSVTLHFGDMTDSSSLARILKEVQPSEVYNLAAQSHVAVSFETPEYTASADGIGALRVLEAMRLVGLMDARFYQASTSELYGKVREIPQRETTPFYPRSPYGVAKLYAYWITVNYREAYGMHASNGILFNHESEQRGELFVTRKISKHCARVAQGSNDVLSLGNMASMRDWGDADEYVRGMHLIVQQERADDYVLATGETHSVKEFVELAFRIVGREVEWEGAGVDEVGRDAKSGATLVRVDPRYFRPTEVDLLVGDPSKAKEKLGWTHEKSFPQLVADMVASDVRRQQNIAAGKVTLEDFV